MVNAKCFKCEKEVKSACKGVSSWDMPWGVHFSGGGNFGSRLYDSLMDGISVELVICDECLKAYQGLLRHHRYTSYKNWFMACQKCDHGKRYLCDRMGNEIPEQLELEYGEE